MINILSNTHQNIDLSEQNMVSDCCEGCGDCVEGGSFYRSVDHLRVYGVVDEACSPYNVTESVCNLCPDYLSRIPGR